MSGFKNNHPMLQNILSGIILTYTGFTTAPTNLANATDNDLTTSTGTASITLGSGGGIGTLLFDLGRNANILTSCRLGLWSSAGTMYAYIENGDLETEQNILPGIATTNENTFILPPQLLKNCRHIRLRFYATAAGTYNVKVYDANAYELG